MRHIIIASHHYFAAGLKDTLEFIGGDLGIIDVNAYVDGALLEDQIADAFASLGKQDEVLILTDMMQGSVCQAFMPYMGEKVFLVAGVNLPSALELAISKREYTPSYIEEVLNAARQQLVLLNNCSVEIGDDDE